MTVALHALAACDAIDEPTRPADASDSEATADADIGLEVDDGRDLDETETNDADGEGDDGHTDSLAHCLLIDSTDWINFASLSVLDLDTGELRENLTNYHADATIQVVDGDVYVINRLYSDSVMKLDPSDNYRILWEFSTGNGTNPKTLVRYKNRGFLTLYDRGVVAEVTLENPTAETFLTGRTIEVPLGIDDGARADVADAFLYNDVLYVVNQNLDESLECVRGARSRLHAYDPETLAPVAAFDGGAATSLELRSCNSFVYKRRGSELLIRGIGNYQFMTSETVNDGVVEAVDLATGRRGPLLFTEQGAGDRDIFILAENADESRMWAVLSGDDFFGIDLVELDRSNPRWSVGRELYTGYLWDIAAYDGRLYVSKRDLEDAGILVFDMATGDLVPDETIRLDSSPDELVRFDREGSCW